MSWGSYRSVSKESQGYPSTEDPREHTKRHIHAVREMLPKMPDKASFAVMLCDNAIVQADTDDIDMGEIANNRRALQRSVEESAASNRLPGSDGRGGKSQAVIAIPVRIFSYLGALALSRCGIVPILGACTSLGGPGLLLGGAADAGQPRQGSCTWSHSALSGSSAPSSRR